MTLLISEDKLSQGEIQAELARHGVKEALVEVFDSLPSTSTYLSEIVRRGSNSVGIPRLCIADLQTQGNGRRGKAWQSARGNITFSLLTHTASRAEHLLGLSLVSGIAVAEALEMEAGVRVQLKWPNDVIFEQAKLCGLLTELTASPDGQGTFVITGIGINTVRDERIRELGIGGISLVEVCESPPGRSQLIAVVAANIVRAYAQFYEHGWAAFADIWRRFDCLEGKSVSVIAGGQETRATAVGVDRFGALLVEKAGKVEALISGDVSIRFG